VSPRPVAPDDASGEILRPTRQLRDDAPTLRRMLRPDLTPRSLRRSHDAEGRAREELAHDERVRRRRRPALPGRLGYQPGLDGLRGLSVLAVIGYHAGFGWLRGGWIGVEVFFVVSGFLITSLLVEEREATGRVDLRQFWLRRARRLLPALGVMLAVIATVTLVVGSAAERAGVRRDLPWALAYLSNWGQITGDIPYFAADAPVLRHLWSLAIEEQFYVVWPLVFVALVRTRMRPLAVARLLAILACAAMVATVVLQLGGPGPLGLLGGVDRTNFMYLSTFTRSSGLLLGAAAAYVWRPGRRHTGTGGDPGRALDLVGGLALAVLACAAIAATLTAGYVYLWLLPVVSVLSLAAVLVTVHPSSQLVRRALSWRPLVLVGTRSYGLYLWHWPVFVLVGATHGSVRRFLTASAITVVVTELSHRVVETPARRGGLGHWWRHAGPARTRVLLVVSCGVLLVAGCYGAVRPFDPAVGGGDASFTAPTAPAVTASPDDAVQPPPAPTTPVSTATHLAIVGDSQAHSLAVNLPDGIDDTFVVTDGAIDGCSVYDAGRVLSARTTFRNYFQICAGWQGEWADAVARADASVALVVLGAWDVFDRETADGTVLTYATPAWDADLAARLQEGIDALVGAGARVAILEVGCMRPISVEGAAVPVLPERADDSRVAHVNEIFREVAAANAATTTFVEGPNWCGDEALATDVGMRWDGVHVYKPGARLIFDTIAPALLAP
jgi:peptidoglycan/LPS O-acetylase OafA/YrhL